MKNKRYIIQVLFLLVLFMMWGAMVFIHYKQRVMIDEYKEVIAKQDSMINELSFSNELVKKYFEIQEDSSTHCRIYILKTEYSEIIREKEYIENKPSIILDGKEISTDELLTLYNSNEEANNATIRELVERYNSLLQRYNIIVSEKYSIADTLQMQRMALDLMKKNFDISYTGEIKSPSISVHLLCEKADSAYALLGYYRNKMTYDPKKRAWIITR